MMTISQDHAGTFLTADQEWKISLYAKREIARKFYRAGIVPPSGVGLDLEGGTIRPHFNDFILSLYLTYRAFDFLTTFQINSR